MIIKDQADFMKLAGQKTHRFCQKQSDLYAKLIEEEAYEFIETQGLGYDSPYIADHIKEAVDMIVVATGFLISNLGVEGAQHAWNLVHESNLVKVQGKVEKREDGKVLKNDEYKREAKVKLMTALDELVRGF